MLYGTKVICKKLISKCNVKKIHKISNNFTLTLISENLNDV